MTTVKHTLCIYAFITEVCFPVCMNQQQIRKEDFLFMCCKGTLKIDN